MTNESSTPAPLKLSPMDTSERLNSEGHAQLNYDFMRWGPSIEH